MTQLATVERTSNHVQIFKPVPTFQILDKYAENGVSPVESRINAIATISGGYRGDNNAPQRTTDGSIFIHGDAPGLQEVLQSRGGKSVTIMFPSDDPRDFVQQRFAEYSASELKAYGDEREITILSGGQRVTHAAGTAGYKSALEKCKVSVSVYFSLAEWTPNGCDMIFPDGFGLYRLRFTSMNSLRSILASVQHMAKTTGGKIAAIPFELFLRKEEHSDPTGKKRSVWIWQSLPKPPQGIRFTASYFRAVMESGQNQRAMFQLEAPKPETLEMATHDIVVEDGDEANADDDLERNLDVAQSGGLCDAKHVRAAYFAIVNDTPYANDEARRMFVLEWTDERFSSLSKYLEGATTENASQFVEFVKTTIRVRTLEIEYSKLMNEGEKLGMKRVPLDSNDPRRIEHLIGGLKSAIARRKEAQKAAPKPEAPKTPLMSAVGQRHEQAVAPPTEEEQAEIDRIYNQNEVPIDARPNDVVASEDETVEGEIVAAVVTANIDDAPAVMDISDWPIPLQNVYLAAQSAKLDVSNFLDSLETLTAVNGFLATKNKGSLATMADITAAQGVACLGAIHRGDLKW